MCKNRCLVVPAVTLESAAAAARSASTHTAPAAPALMRVHTPPPCAPPLAAEVALGVVLLQVEVECLLAGHLVALQEEVLQLPQTAMGPDSWFSYR